nr:MAG TPA: hypothetical protein [Caudoviricetes sp.]
MWGVFSPFIFCLFYSTRFMYLNYFACLVKPAFM